jgi:hypothetical protein
MFAMGDYGSWIKNSHVRRMLLVEKARDHEVDKLWLRISVN